ncbi:MAG: hypothetical protein RL758_144 [Pseudomonadota bacterium]|jgi:hypothetical protein
MTADRLAQALRTIRDWPARDGSMLDVPKQVAAEALAAHDAAQAPAEAHGEAPARVAAYIQRRKQAKCIDVEYIHGFDVGPDGGFELRLSDLEALLSNVQPKAAEGDAPAWYAVTSLRAPTIDKVIRRLDVAEEYADKQREVWPDVEVVPLYTRSAPKAQPKGMPLTETREYKHAMGNWLGAVGELIEAMGRPKFAADTPVAVIAEAIREAAKRLAAQAPASAHGPTGKQVVEALREAMERAGVPHSFRADLVGYFCNGWNGLVQAPAVGAEPATREVCGRSYVEVRTEAVDWLKKHYPALCEKSGLCERIGGQLYTRSVTPASSKGMS